MDSRTEVHFRIEVYDDIDMYPDCGVQEGWDQCFALENNPHWYPIIYVYGNADVFDMQVINTQVATYMNKLILDSGLISGYFLLTDPGEELDGLP